MHNEYDVIIVGAGPAGSTAAYMLNRKKYKILLLDKENFPRKKLCGGCLTAKTLWLLNRVFNVSEDLLIEKEVINFKTNRFDVCYKTKNLVCPTSPYAFRFVERSSYDTFFLKKVKESDVEVREGEKVIHIDIDSHNLSLSTSNGNLLKTKFLIAADGANSIIRTSLLKKKYIDGSQWQRNLSYCLETFLPKEKDFQNFSIPVLSFGYLRYGYAWIFPNKDRLVAGMGGPARLNKNLKKKFETFIKDYHLDSLEKPEFKGFPLPCGNSLFQPFYKNILLAGDAAGLVDPMLGEGIFQAHRSGELAAQAITNAFPLHSDKSSIEHAGQEYQNLLRQHLQTEFDYARAFRKILYSPLGHLIGFRHVKLLSRHFSKLAEVVHGRRTYKWFKKF